MVGIFQLFVLSYMFLSKSVCREVDNIDNGGPVADKDAWPE